MLRTMLNLGRVHTASFGHTLKSVILFFVSCIFSKATYAKVCFSVIERIAINVINAEPRRSSHNVSVQVKFTTIARISRHIKSFSSFLRIPFEKIVSLEAFVIVRVDCCKKTLTNWELNHDNGVITL